MNMPAGIDSVYWAVGGLLGALALWLLYWSLFHDRSRGRRRCPKCWYDMCGTPGNLTCSECGYVAKRERKLRRTCRRWRWAAVAIVLGVISTAITVWPTIHRQGAERVVPTTVLIVIAPWLQSVAAGVPVTPQIVSSPASISPVGSRTTLTSPSATVAPAATHWSQRLLVELERRAILDTVSDWQWRLLIRRFGLTDNPPWTMGIQTRDRWVKNWPLYCAIDFRRNASACPGFDNENLRIRVTPSFDGAETLEFSQHGMEQDLRLAVQAQDRLGWFRPLHAVGCPPGDTRLVQFTVEVSRLNDAAARTLWRQSFEVPLALEDSVDDIMSPVHSSEIGVQLARDIQIEVTSSGVYAHRGRIATNPCEGVTCAVRVELLEGNVPLASTVLCWNADGSSPWNQLRFWLDSTGNAIQFPGISDQNTLRIRGEVDTALCDFNSSLYWSGEIQLAIRKKTSRDLVCESEPLTGAHVDER